MRSQIRRQINVVRIKLRKHFNSKRKTKLSFESEEEATKYIKKHHLTSYKIYFCSYCSKYHISHQQDD